MLQDALNMNAALLQYERVKKFTIEAEISKYEFQT
jgi:hypothetical protein